MARFLLGDVYDMRVDDRVWDIVVAVELVGLAITAAMSSSASAGLRA